MAVSEEEGPPPGYLDLVQYILFDPAYLLERQRLIISAAIGSESSTPLLLLLPFSNHLRPDITSKMQVLNIVAVLLLAVTTLHAADAASDTPVCKSEIIDTYFAHFSYDCSNILTDFRTCSDDCLANMKNLVQYSPTDCTLTIKGDPSMRESTEKDIKKCEAARTNAASRYIPKPSPGAEECATVQTSPWNAKYGSSGNAYYDCSFDAQVGKPCPDNCVKVIEEGILAAPMCRRSSTTNLTMFEQEKRGLVSCLTVRGEGIKNNTVLLSTTNKDGDSVDQTAAPTTTPTPTTRSTLTTISPSAEITTSSPTAASSTSSLSVSLTAAVGSVVVAMIATL